MFKSQSIDSDRDTHCAVSCLCYRQSSTLAITVTGSISASSTSSCDSSVAHAHVDPQVSQLIGARACTMHASMHIYRAAYYVVLVQASLRCDTVDVGTTDALCCVIFSCSIAAAALPLLWHSAACISPRSL
jgi:hypothetical protein